MAEEHHEEVVGDIVVGGHTLLLFGEVMGEGGFEVGRPRSQNHLVSIDWLAFDHQRDVTELLLVQDREKVFLILIHLHDAAGT